MASYVLIHGAGSDSWYWHLVAPELRARGHDVVAPDLPCEDDAAGFPEYADVVVDAIGSRSDLVVVAQSLAGFTAPLLCERVRVRMLILVAAMVPRSGEAAGDWWANTGWQHASREQLKRDGRAPDAAFA
jgi:pimeloyl-ACP methyl ester carboxylesterase